MWRVMPHSAIVFMTFDRYEARPTLSSPIATSDHVVLLAALPFVLSFVLHLPQKLVVSREGHMEQGCEWGL